jgi:Cu/Ag efflux protein CusF
LHREGIMRILVLAVAFMLIIPMTVMSPDFVQPASAAEKKAEKRFKERTMKGEVKAVDPSAKAIIVKGNEEITFVADEIILKDIKVSDRVTVKYIEKDGYKTANSIKADSKQKRRRIPAKTSEAK